jgi:hypothetical protein
MIKKWMSGTIKLRSGNITTTNTVPTTSLIRVRFSNLYDIGFNHPSEITFAEVKRQLSQEEHEKVARGDLAISLEGLSPGDFVVAALDLENIQ